jgi:MSHA biogenesis protein MshP
MCPNHLFTAHRQSGFLLPLALFIVVVMGLLALSLTRTTQQVGVSAVQEAISVQAFYAAESGAQQAMQAMFYQNDLRRQSVDARCITRTFNYTVDGLKNCTAVVSCTCRYRDASLCSSGTNNNYLTNSAVPESYYTLASVATCGTAPLTATRTIQVGTFLNQE